MKAKDVLNRLESEIDMIEKNGESKLEYFINNEVKEVCDKVRVCESKKIVIKQHILSCVKQHGFLSEVKTKIEELRLDLDNTYG